MTDYTLAHGSHKNAKDGRCAMEWVAYLAGEKHSDSPACPRTIRQKLDAGYGECRVCHKLLKPDRNGYPLRHGGHAHPCPGVRQQLSGYIPDAAGRS